MIMYCNLEKRQKHSMSLLSLFNILSDRKLWLFKKDINFVLKGIKFERILRHLRFLKSNKYYLFSVIISLIK